MSLCGVTNIIFILSNAPLGINPGTRGLVQLLDVIEKRAQTSILSGPNNKLDKTGRMRICCISQVRVSRTCDVAVLLRYSDIVLV